MAVYSITYDLIDQKNYAKVIKAIHNISGTYTKITKSQWIVESTANSVQIRNYLNNYIDHDDKVFVCKIDKNDWAAKNIETQITEWMQSRLG